MNSKLSNYTNESTKSKNEEAIKKLSKQLDEETLKQCKKRENKLHNIETPLLQKKEIINDKIFILLLEKIIQLMKILLIFNVLISAINVFNHFIDTNYQIEKLKIENKVTDEKDEKENDSFGSGVTIVN